MEDKRNLVRSLLRYSKECPQCKELHVEGNMKMPRLFL